MVTVLFGAALQPLLVVRRDLRLGVDAFEQSAKKRILVHDGGGDALETAFFEPTQPGHYGDIADRQLRKHNKQHHRWSTSASSEDRYLINVVCKALPEAQSGHGNPELKVESAMLRLQKGSRLVPPKHLWLTEFYKDEFLHISAFSVVICLLLFYLLYVYARPWDCWSSSFAYTFLEGVFSCVR